MCCQMLRGVRKHSLRAGGTERIRVFWSDGLERSLYVVVRPSVVCRLSVTFVHPILRRLKFSAMFLRHLVLWYWHPGKILRRSSQGNPPSGELNTRAVAEYIAILDLSNAISRKGCKVGAKFVLITNRKSHMSFQLVPN